MKTLLKVTLLLLTLLLIFYFSANFVLKKLSGHLINELKPTLEQRGIHVQNFNYSRIHLISYNSFALNDVDLDFSLDKGMYGKESFRAQFDAQSISLSFADFENPSFFFDFKDYKIFVEPEETSSNKSFGKIENGYLKTRIPFYLENPIESGREIIDEVRILFTKDSAKIDIMISADVLLSIDDKEVKVGLSTTREKNHTHLKFNAGDIYAAAEKFEIELAEKEAEIISNHPSKVPSMIKITRDAKRLSSLEKSNDEAFPEDAYRHIYWSYHLSKQLGPSLAKEITDAHETIPGNTIGERNMDIYNNELGIQMSNQVLSSEEIRKFTLNSERVIRNPLSAE